MARFPGVDYLLIDSQFCEQELMVRQTARQFVDERVMPLIRDCFRDARFPKELIPEMGRLGFLGANLEGYGCAGMSNVEYGLVMQELERGDSGMRSFVSVQGALVMYPILTFGSEEQKQRWLPQAAIGRGARMLRADRAGVRIESGGNADPGAARRRGWVINGRKTWITNGRWRTWPWCGPRRGWHSRIPGGEGTPGFTSSEMHGKLSMRASVTASLAFNDCRVPESAMLPEAKGLKGRAGLPDAGPLRDRMGSDRRGHGLLRNGALLFGPAQAVRRSAHRVASVGAGETGGHDHGDHQGAVAGAAGRQVEGQGKAEPAHISMLKRNNVGMALDCARLSRDLLGANGIMDEYPIMRHMCNLETVKTYEGTDHIHTLVIGERVTGVAAYK